MGDFKDGSYLKEKIENETVKPRKRSVNNFIFIIIIILIDYLATPFIEEYYHPETKNGQLLKSVVTVMHNKISEGLNDK